MRSLGPLSLDDTFISAEGIQVQIDNENATYRIYLLRQPPSRLQYPLCNNNAAAAKTIGTLTCFLFFRRLQRICWEAASSSGVVR